jgi:hypothetical protein
MKARAPTASGWGSVRYDACASRHPDGVPSVNQLDHSCPEPRPSIRMDARLDPTTRTKVDDLAQHFHRPRAAVLCQIMQWGLSHELPGPLD